MRDFIQDIGLSLLPHHLRRVVDLMMAELTEELQAQNFIVPPRSLSTIELLGRHGPLRVTEVAEQLQLAHPYVIRKTSRLIDLGLVEELADENDARVRLLQLSALGKKERRKINVYFEILEKVYAEIRDEIGIDLFEGAIRAKSALEKETFSQRLKRAIKKV